MSSRHKAPSCVQTGKDEMTHLNRLGMSHAGVSVIELMVAMSISLILLLGMVKIFLGSKESYKVRENISMMQETARFGLESLTSAILMADHWGGVISSDLSITASGLSGVSGSSTCNAAWVTNISQAVFGADGNASIGSVTGFDDCVANAEYVANSDVLILRYAAGQPLDNAFVQSTSGPDNSDDLFVRTSTGEKGTLLKGGVDPAAATSLSDQNGTNNYQYRVEAYFLRPCSVLDSGTCSNGIPTLTRLTFKDGGVSQEPLVDGVEQMQFQYGIDTSSDGQVEQFVSASSVTNWNQVAAVRVDMLVRTESQDPDFQDPNATYTLAGGTADNGLVYVVSASDRGFHRKRLTKVVQIRNRTRF